MSLDYQLYFGRPAPLWFVIGGWHLNIMADDPELDNIYDQVTAIRKGWA
jgi:hypothetical protein